MYDRRKHGSAIMLSCLAFPGSFFLKARRVVVVKGMDSNFTRQGYLILIIMQFSEATISVFC